MINTSQLARIALVTFLIVGGFMVLEPFMTAILLAAVICVSTWSFYEALWNRLRRRDTLAAGVMTLLLVVALVVPVAYFAGVGSV